MGSLTTDQVLALAPDAASAKAGQGLAARRKWVSTGRDERAVWGECAGSAALPYQVVVDTAETAFHCTCPSRKIPCKHVLGLLLLGAADPAAVPPANRPAWAAEWLTAREARAEKRAAREAAAEAQPADRPDRPDRPDRSASSAQRAERVAVGLEGIARWLEDMVRQGLAGVQARPRAYWDEPAARLVDAQAPGAARLVRGMARLPASGQGWPDRLLEAAGRLHLLAEGHARVDTVPPEARDDLRAAVGFTAKQEEVLAGDGVRDRWAVLGQRVEGEERLRVRRTWLRGESTGRPALLLAFAVGSQPLEPGVAAGAWIEGDVVFYPGAAPLRGLLREGHAAAGALDRLPGPASLAAATAEYAAALARNPWLERYPLALRDVVPVRRGGGWSLCDASGDAVELDAAADARAWVLLALSGGRPIDVFGEWEGERLHPISACAGGRFVPLDGVVAGEGAA